LPVGHEAQDRPTQSLLIECGEPERRHGATARTMRSLVPTIPLLLFLSFVPGTATQAQDLNWQRLTEGLSVSVWKPGARCPEVPATLVTDIDPQHYRFSVHYFAQEGFAEPPTIEAWYTHTGHHVLFNAGLFTHNFDYLGLLYKDGHSLGSRRHSTWQGLFVAEPTAGTGKRARVLDLKVDHFDEQRLAYREAAQALMLVDGSGTIRVRRTGKRAFQTLVAETTGGHITVFKTLDPVSLYDIGECLKETLPMMHHVMAMDGGSSSDILIPGSLWLAGLESPSSWPALFAGTTAFHIPLPAVIGISPR
jgi:hypothetical protein